VVVALVSLALVRTEATAKEKTKQTRQEQVLAKLAAAAQETQAQAAAKSLAPRARLVSPEARSLAKLIEQARSSRSKAVAKPALPSRIAEDGQARLAKLARRTQEESARVLATKGTPTRIAAKLVRPVLVRPYAEGLSTRAKLVALARAAQQAGTTKSVAPRPSAKIAAALQVDEDEAGSLNLYFDQEVSGTLSPAGDVDGYVFQGEAGQTIDLTLLSEDFDTVVELLLNDEQIGLNDDSEGDRNARLIDFTLPETGAYQVQVHSYNNGYEGTYRLLVAQTAPPQPTLIDLSPGYVEGSLLAGQQQLYRFYVGERSRVQLDLISSDFDAYLTLYSGSSEAEATAANQLSSDDDSGDGYDSRLALSLDPGYYLAEARGLGSAAGAYAIELSVAAEAEDEDAAGPVALSYGEERAGVLYPAGDTDEYSFYGEAGQIIDLALNSGEFDTYLELEQAGAQIAFDDDNGDGTSSLIQGFVLPVTGEYLVRARSYGNAYEGAYTLSVVLPVSPVVWMGEIGIGLYGQALAAGQFHLYALTLSSASQVTIDLTSTDFDTYLSLYTGGGQGDWRSENLYAVDDDGGEGSNSHLELVLQPGSYLIESRAFYGTAEGGYELAVGATSLDQDEDQSGPIAFGYGLEATAGLFPVSDADLYSFYGEAGDVIDVVLTSGEFDCYLQLEYNGETIAVDDDGGGGLNSMLNDLVLPADGEYLIRAGSYGNGGAGSYLLSLTQAASPFTLAGEGIGPGLYGGYLGAGDIHLYTFFVDQPSQVRLDLTSDEFDAFLVLYTGEGPSARLTENRLAVDDDGGGGLNSQIALELQPGWYLVEARGLSTEAQGGYLLTLSSEVLAPDEDAAGPVPLALGTAFSGVLLPSGDEDTYTFHADAGTVIDLALSSDEFDAYLELAYDGSTIAANDDGGGGLNSLLDDLVLPATGEYQIKARGLSWGSTGVYTISLEDVTPRLSLFSELTEGAVEGELAESEQLQLYPLHLTAAAQVQIDLESDYFDPYLTLYQGQGTGDRRAEQVVAADDDSGPGVYSRIVAVLQPGYYLVEVRPLSSPGIGPYTLRLTTIDVQGDEDAQGSVAIAYGASRQGSLTPAGDTDAYLFSGTAGDVVDVSLTSPGDPPGFDAYLELARNGQVIATDDDGGENLNSLLDDFVLPATGQYLVRARSYADAGTGDYTLTLENATPAIRLKSALAVGKLTDELARSGEIHLRPFTVAERSLVTLELTPAGWDGVLVLYSGQTAADRTASRLVAQATGTQAVPLSRELPAGTYLVEVRAATSAHTGTYSLDYQAQVVRQQQARDRVVITSGTLNDEALAVFDPAITVEPSAKISGMVEVRVTNAHSGSEVFPVGATATWGNRETAWWQVAAWAPPGESNQTVRVDLTAPTTPGTYYLIVVAAASSSLADIMSGTDASSGAQRRWGDGDDVAAWDSLRTGPARQTGWVSVVWSPSRQIEVGAAVVRVVVAAPATETVQTGPVAIDFGQTAGGLGVSRLDGVSVGDTVRIQLQGDDLPRISGWSARVVYDPERVRYVDGSFTPSTLLPGLLSLVDAREGSVEVGGAVLGTNTSAEGDGLLGTLSFEVLPGFVFSSELVIDQVSLRTLDQGRVKLDVRSVGLLSAESATAGVPAGPVSLDFGSADGDDGQRRATGAAAGATYEVQLHVAGAPRCRGWSARLEFDATRLRYRSGSFSPGTFITGLTPLVAEREGRIDLGGAVLGVATTGEGNGFLGTMTFEVLPAFTDSSVVTITQVSFSTTASGEVIQAVQSIAIIAAASATGCGSGMAGDFDCNSSVEFSDFFLFADAFGSRPGEANYNAACDLDGNGEVDFSDFFQFADAFGRGSLGKLLELARERLGLPAAARLEQNYPNPFNQATTIRYLLTEVGSVRLAVYDAGGQLVRTLVEGSGSPGYYQASWDGHDDAGRAVASGVYLYRLEAGRTASVRKLLLLQ
jgi:hypothetical protein